jgi:probable rRNA maturation factor
LVIIHKAVEGVSGTMLARFLNRGRRILKLDGEVTLLLASSVQLRRLNRKFRGQDYATDVLSFPSEIPHQRQKRPSPGPRAGYVGDIAISADMARQNGRRLGHGVAVEIKTLILHGLLHLVGYDHESDNGRMARREVRLRGALGLPEGLIERSNPDHSGRAKGKPARPASAAAKAETGGGKLRVRRSRPGVRGPRGSGGVPDKPVVGLLGLSGRRGKER